MEESKGDELTSIFIRSVSIQCLIVDSNQGMNSKCFAAAQAVGSLEPVQSGDGSFIYHKKPPIIVSYFQLLDPGPRNLPESGFLPLKTS